LRQRSQAQFDVPERGDGILDDKGEVVFNVEFDLTAKVGAFDEEPQMFQTKVPLNDLFRVVLLDELHGPVGLNAPDFGRREGPFAPEDQLVGH